MRMVGWIFALLLCGQATAADELRGPALGAASNFGQGFLADLQTRSTAVGIIDFRDAVYWDRVEQRDRSYVFDRPDTLYPDVLFDAGATMSLTINNGHPDYDDGNTPTSPEGIAGFAHHATETIARFPAITAIEVGNEFNSANFVSGPLRNTGLDDRAAAYVALLKAVWTEAKAARPDVRIIGGGVHSIPTGYLKMLLNLGAADFMDSLALHPYDTPIEHLAAEIAIMRMLPGLEDIPIEITEFGSQDAGAAPDAFLRSYCQMALSGVSRAVWYGLNVRGDGYIPLLTRDLQTTSAWQAFQLAQIHFEGKPVINAAPDQFSRACLFDSRHLVIWGMPRTVIVLADDVDVFGATGEGQAGDTFTLSETVPLVFSSDRPLDLENDFSFADQDVVADSYYQFYANGTPAFRRYAETNGIQSAFGLMPGQARSNRPWTPWFGVRNNGDVRLLPNTLLPAGTVDWPVEVVHEYIAISALNLNLTAHFEAAERSRDGIHVTIRLNDILLAENAGQDPQNFAIDDIALNAGDSLTFAVGPRNDATGDVTDYRITLRQTP